MLPPTVALSVLATTAAFAVAVPTGSAAPQHATPAAARCQVDGGGSDSEWSLTAAKRVGVSCAAAKTVIRACASKRTVPGWKLTKPTGSMMGPRFTSTSGKKRFDTIAAGGSPKCISALHGY